MANTLSQERKDEFFALFLGEMSEEELDQWVQAQPDSDALQALLAIEINAFVNS
ncbi:MAG: hypothetical protein AAFY26_02175 [Cyanobacteria bacterium J06638_22]